MQLRFKQKAKIRTYIAEYCDLAPSINNIMVARAGRIYEQQRSSTYLLFITRVKKTLGFEIPPTQGTTQIMRWPAPYTNECPRMNTYDRTCPIQ